MLTHVPDATVPWKDWLRRWDTQQGVYIEDRERAYEVMFSFVEALLPREITVLDLAAGPGAISQRLLGRFPQARSVAVDVDPVLLAVGRGAMGDAGGRLRWVRADLREPGWTAALGEERFDAVLSSTATHWLAADALARMYGDLAGLLRPGGILLNADGFTLPHTQPRLAAACGEVDRGRQERAVGRGAEGWQDWWDALRAEPSLAAAFAERDQVFARPTGRIFAEHGERGSRPTLALHEAALVAAGFDEVGSVWQDLHKHILLALR